MQVTIVSEKSLMLCTDVEILFELQLEITSKNSYATHNCLAYSALL